MTDSSLDTPQQEELRKYFNATFEDKLLRELPEKDADYTTPATKLLEKRREMNDVETTFVSQKEGYHVKMDVLNRRREDLEKKEQDLTESLFKFDRFLKENEARRKRAIQKAADEQAIITEKDKEIDKLNAKLDKLRQRRERNDRLLKKYSTYDNFLRDTIDLSRDFNETRELITRHATLHITNSDLTQREDENQSSMDKLKESAAKFKEESRIHKLNCNNQLAALQTQLEAATTDAMYWDGQLQGTQSSASKRTLLLGRIKMATANLYALVWKRGKGTREKLESSLDQLDKIKLLIQDLQDVTAEYQA